jgi:hypothetical protein
MVISTRPCSLDSAGGGVNTAGLLQNNGSEPHPCK